jgi:hypothetical protein
VTRFYKEYLKLNQLHDLSIVYQELKGDIIPFLKLYRSAKAAGMSEQHVVNLLRIANSIDNDNNNLPAVEHRYQKLTQEVNSLEIRKLNSNRTLQDLRKRILSLRKALDSCLTQITNRKNIRTPFTFYAYFLITFFNCIFVRASSIQNTLSASGLKRIFT